MGIYHQLHSAHKNIFSIIYLSPFLLQMQMNCTKMAFPDEYDEPSSEWRKFVEMSMCWCAVRICSSVFAVVFCSAQKALWKGNRRIVSCLVVCICYAIII